MSFWNNPTIAGAGIGASDAIDQMNALRQALAQRAFENDLKTKANTRADEEAAGLQEDRKAQAKQRQLDSDLKLLSTIDPDADLSENPAALAAAARVGLSKMKQATPAVPAVEGHLPSTQMVGGSPLPGADDSGAPSLGALQTTQVPAQAAVAAQPAVPAHQVYAGTAQQLQAQKDKQLDDSARKDALNDPNVPDEVKQQLKMNPNMSRTDLVKAYVDAKNNASKESIANNANETKTAIATARAETLKELEILRDQFRGQLTGLQGQLLDAKIDALKAKANGPAPVLGDSDVRTSSFTNTPYVNLGGMTGKTKDQARQEAKAQGAVPLEAKDSDKLGGIQAVSKNLQDFAGTYLPKLATSAIGRLGQGVLNTGKAITQYDPDLATMDKNWIDMVGVLKSAIGGGGVRITKAEVDKLLTTNAVSKFDTQATAQKKIDYLTGLLRGEEEATLGKKPGVNAPGVPDGVTITRTK